MLHKFNNNNLYIALETLGASLCSLCDLHGTEYLWQDSKKGLNSGMPIVFGVGEDVLEKQFKILEKTSTKLSMVYDDAENELSLKTTYELMENTLSVLFSVENKSCTEKTYTLGTKPCFFVPIDQDEEFEDYVIKSGNDAYFLNDFKENINEFKFGNTNWIKLYSLESGRGIDISHEALDDISGVTIKSDELLCFTLKTKNAINKSEVKEHSFKITII